MTEETYDLGLGDVPPSLSLPLDLNDPVTANEVADAIRRMHPDRYVPLSERYPWRTVQPGQTATLLDAVVFALRSSADVHEAERIPHLVAPLRALADALEAGALAEIPPGRCGEPGPITYQRGRPQLASFACENRYGHTGMHEATYYPPVPGLHHGMPVAWWSDGVDPQITAAPAQTVRSTRSDRYDYP